MATVADDQIVQLLREIRDSQNSYIELYKSAIANQQASIDLQKKALRRQKILLPTYLAILVLVVAAMQIWLK